jgi:hypothetical protein
MGEGRPLGRRSWTIRSSQQVTSFPRMVARQMSKATRRTKASSHHVKITYSADGDKAFVTGNPLENSKQPAGEDYSAGGGEADVTGNPLDEGKQPAGKDYSAGGGEAFATGNPQDIASSQKVKITPRVMARHLQQATRWTTRAAKR